MPADYLWTCACGGFTAELAGEPVGATEAGAPGQVAAHESPGLHAALSAWFEVQLQPAVSSSVFAAPGLKTFIGHAIG